VRRVLPYLTLGVLTCLGGFAYWYLWRKLSSISSPDYCESIENELAELKTWRRTVQSELESQFERIRSIAGRVDRAKRKEPTSQEAQGEEQTIPHDLDDQGKLNAILARRVFGGGNA
jgi:hypothetical protein